MISKHATVLTCSTLSLQQDRRGRIAPWVLLIVSYYRGRRGVWPWLVRERENRFVSFSYSPLPFYVCCSMHAIHLPIPRTHIHVTISNRSRYSSSTASGQQSFIIMSSGAVMNVLLGTKSGPRNDDDVMEGALRTYITPSPIRICTATSVSLPVWHCLPVAVPHVNNRFRNQV